ncbi:glycosyltransferase family 87 protein [uncultured Gimesia sp.]|uniref:glycosyltransferase family 87 protein n=1 Tax=uncultured Gimesia sp. TaxID=1678688 RepID=UPI0030D867B2|tara:strand:+ start:36556 stop:37815 length:1260 start_codon:yes stop_codon:yes gene_type:complete
MSPFAQNPLFSKSPQVEEASGALWLKRALILWAVLWIAVSVKFVVQPERKSVYPCFADSSINWWADRSLYDNETQDTGFRYSPTFALAFSPFAILPAPVGGILWSALNIALLVFALRLLIKEIFPGDWTKFQEACFLMLSLAGCTRAIWSAQSNSLVFALAVFAMVSLKKERWWSAGFLLAAAVHIKLWPAALALLLMARFPKQLAFRFAAAGAILIIPPFLTRPLPVVLQQYQDWYALLTGPYRTLRQAGLRDAYTIAEHFGTYVDDRVYTLLQLVLAGLALLWCLRLAKITRSTETYFTGVLTTWVCWQLLAGPGTERLTFLLAAPIASWALIVSFKEHCYPLLATIAWLMLIPLGMGGVERLLLPIASWSPAILPLGIIPLMAWQIVYVESRADLSQSAQVIGRSKLQNQDPSWAA